MGIALESVWCMKSCGGGAILQAGRYKSPEENPFFPEYLPQSVVPDYPFSKVIHHDSDVLFLSLFRLEQNQTIPF